MRIATGFMCVLSGALAGCSSMLPSTAPPVYYQVEYHSEAVECPARFGTGVRVWPFETSAPYGRREMAVAEQSRQVLFSGAYQWVASPGVMVADRLIEDFSAGSLFSLAVGADSPVEVPLELTGRVFEFAWRKSADGARAALQVEVSLTRTAPHRKLLFRREYSLGGAASRDDSSAVFAKAMSELVRSFSVKLRRDLCAAAEKEGT
jgi:ABC-type uncharacterized transport system auxiliary subunit